MVNLVSKGKKRPTYSRGEKQKALMLVAFHNGNTGIAYQQLEQEADGGQIPSRQTLDGWKRTEAQLYQDCINYLDSQTIPEIDRNLRLGIAVGNEALEQLYVELRAGRVEAKDLSTISRNASVSMGIATEKSQLLKGNATERVEHVEPTWLLEQMAQMAAQQAPRQIADADITAEEE
jgi:hypothetical protein